MVVLYSYYTEILLYDVPGTKSQKTVNTREAIVFAMLVENLI